MPESVNRGLKQRKETDTERNGHVDTLLKSFNVFYCLDCGKCTGTCPVSEVKSGFSPRRIVELAAMEGGDETADNIFLWDCLTCGKCTNYCPEDVHFPEFVRSLRTLAADNGNISVMNHGGVTYSIAYAMADQDLKQKRLDWVQDVKVTDKGEDLLFTGCMVHFDLIFEQLGLEGGKNILANAVKVMNRAGIVPVVLKGEVCCGHDQLWSGDEATFKKLMKKNIDQIKASGAKRIVTVCPECASVLKKEYREIGGLDIEVVHVSKLIADLLVEKRLTVGAADGKVTFQDPCRLVQHLKEMEAPRDVIRAVNPKGFVEMADSKELASCCGTSLFRGCDAFSEIIRIKRLKQAVKTGAGLLLTACPKCQIHFKCTLSGKCEEVGVDPDLTVKDLVTYVAENME